MEQTIESAKTIGERLHNSRVAKKLTQPQLAKMSGVSQQMISKLENNISSSTAEIFPLADALGISARWLATGSNEKDKTAQNNEGNAQLNADVLRVVIETVESKHPNLPGSRKADLIIGVYSYVLENGTERKHIEKIIKLVV